MDQLMIFSAKYLVYFIIVLACVFLFLQKRDKQKQIAMLSIISLPLAYFLGYIAGKLYYNPRPFIAHHFKPLIEHANTNGFPSDHALICFSISAIVFVFNRKWGIFLAVLSLLVGVARVYAGVHSPIDIAGGFVIGFGVVLMIYLCINNFTHLFHKLSYE